MNKNIIDMSKMNISKVRYIIDESEGSSNNEFGTSWVEIQAFDSNGNNVALNKTINANFTPSLDVTGQSNLHIITNGAISLDEWVSCNIGIQSANRPKIIIDLGDEYILKKIVIYHGWWTKRFYKNIVRVSCDLNDFVTLYDFNVNDPVFEERNKPLILKLK